MRGHNICFYGEILKIIPKLSLLPFLSGVLIGVKTLGGAVSADYIFICPLKRGHIMLCPRSVLPSVHLSVR